LKDSETDFFQNISIRKAILLVRYINFFKQYLRDSAQPSEKNILNKTTGILIPEVLSKDNKSYGSTSLKPLSGEWKEAFRLFISHFEEEMKSY